RSRNLASDSLSPYIFSYSQTPPPNNPTAMVPYRAGEDYHCRTHGSRSAGCAPRGPAQGLQRLLEHREAGNHFRIVLGENAQHADAPRPLALLRARRERPPPCAADNRDEVAAFHSITSSARSNIDVGIVTPIALAVPRFTTSSNMVGCSIGKSAGLAPRRILST